MNNGRHFGVTRHSSTLGAPGLVVTRCHEACAADCNECVRTRSESVGAEWEVERASLPTPGFRWIAIGLAVLVAVLAVLVVLGRKS